MEMGSIVAEYQDPMKQPRYGFDLSASVAMATRELLTTALGDKSSISLNALRPPGLGYYLPPLLRTEASKWIDVGDAKTRKHSVALEKVPARAHANILVRDIPLLDLASSGLFVVKAVVAHEA